MFAKIICDIIQGLFLKAFPWYAYVFYGLEIVLALLLAIAGLTIDQSGGGSFLSLMFVLYAGFNFWLLKGTVRKYYERLHEETYVPRKTRTVQPPQKTFDELAAELRKETDDLCKH